MVKRWPLLIVIVAALVSAYFGISFAGGRTPVYGVTFSKEYATFLGLDWKKTYQEILFDLKVPRLRLSAPWNIIEPRPWNYNFEDLDWMLEEAERAGARVVMVVGRRIPRWPECHDPSWLAGLSKEEIEDMHLALVAATVEHLRRHAAIAVWQVENEPFLTWFGHCPSQTEDFLQKEIALVRSFDTRPIMVTDSGELSLWKKTARAGDLFGTTVYRRVKWARVEDVYLNYRYVYAPVYYWLKARLNGLGRDEFIISELQAEPWVAEGDIKKVSIEEQERSMTVEQFAESVDFARRMGVKEAYLWGVEYWYWMREVKMDAGYVEAARELWGSDE